MLVKAQQQRTNLTPEGMKWAYVTFQQVEHALLSDIFGVVKLLQRLFELVLCHLPLTLLLVVKVQTATLQLLQVMLQRDTKSSC